MEICKHCNMPIRRHGKRGWVHIWGGVFFVRCLDCEFWGFPSRRPRRCPICGSKNLKVEHKAEPFRETQADVE